MKTFYLFALYTIWLSAVRFADAAELDLTFIQPDQYTDIREGFSGPQYSYEDIFWNFEKHLTKLARKLPENYKLEVEVTDIDLAGDIAGGDIRIYMQRYSPRIAFLYRLLDDNQQIVAESQENIRDSAFMTNRSLRYRGDPLGYEKKLFDDWFKDRFPAYLAKH